VKDKHGDYPKVYFSLRASFISSNPSSVSLIKLKGRSGFSSAALLAERSEGPQAGDFQVA
jgi:hypothetical protein